MSDLFLLFFVDNYSAVVETETTDIAILKHIWTIELVEFMYANMFINGTICHLSRY